ncbi:hypothetical protein Tco_1576954 [Tanacetum coccineum]
MDGSYILRIRSEFKWEYAYGNIHSLHIFSYCRARSALLGGEFGSELPGLSDSIRDFPQGKIGVYTRFFEFVNLSLSTFFLHVLTHFGMYISQLIVLGASRISHFEISCRGHGGVPTIYPFRRFYLATSLPTGWITIEQRHKRKNTTVPTCHTEHFDSLKGWRDIFFWVNASVAPIAMRWFDGGEFSQDSPVDRFDGDMTLETLFNDNPTRVRRYPE